MANEKRLIYANRAFEKADEVTFMGFHAEERKRHFMDLVSVILDCPTVDAVEVVHGWWDKYEDDKFIGYDAEGRIKYRKVYTYYCGRCGRGTAVKTNYCPNCGADMR